MQVEQHSLSFVPESERHGKARDLFNVWFSANMDMLVIVTGALAIGYGLNVVWGLIAVVIGNAIGGIFMASHSAQGPKLGIPQMVQSRAQFGVVGAVLPLILVIGMYLGAFFSCGSLGAQAVHSAIPQISVTTALIVLGVITLIITVYGYDLIHLVERYLTIVFLIVFLIATIALFHLHLPAGEWAFSNFHLAPFVVMVSIAATYQMTYAPYVADYSRYLPKNTSSAATFWYSYAGNVISCIWMMIMGVVLAAAFPKFGNDSTGYVAHILGPHFAPIMYLVLVLGIIAIQVLNLYGAFMSTITTLEAFTKITGSRITRFWLVFVISVVGTYLAISGQTGFTTIYNDFMLLLQYFLLPWSAINLIDFYLLRHGDYDVEAMFDVNGKYGRFNWLSISAYVITILLQIPFMNTSIYEGPIARALNGDDIAWAFALALPLIFYYIPMRRKASSSTRNIDSQIA